MKYKDSTCTFEIHSSSFVREPYYVQILFEDQDCTETLMSRYTDYLSAYIDQALSDLKEYAPIDERISGFKNSYEYVPIEER